MGQHSILLVEDSSDDAALSLRAIEACGVPCKVNVITHGGQALGMLLSPDGLMPDLVVLDFHLPGADGLEVLRQLRSNERTRHLMIVMLSSFASGAQLAGIVPQWKHSVGCKACGGTGFKGRVGVCELIKVTAALRHAISAGHGEEQLTAVARNDGMVALLDDGIIKACLGLTTMDEILRVIGETAGHA